MSELIVLTDTDHPTYDEGDILCAFSQRHVHCVHAQHICHHHHAGFNRDGLRPGGMSRQFLDCVYQYRFERVSATEVNRIETDFLGNEIGRELFGKDSMDVESYITRRRKHDKHRIFGAVNREVWHGGHSDMSEVAISKAWDIIKAGSDHVHDNVGNCPHCGQDHAFWSMGRQDIREFLCFQVDDDFSDAEANAMVAPYTEQWGLGEVITDPNGVPVVPIWQENRWQHPTGGWIYARDDVGNVEVTFAKRKVQLENWERDCLGKMEKTKAEVKDKQKAIGREETIDPSRAPWQRGRPDVYKIIDHPRIEVKKDNLTKDKKDKFKVKT